MSAIFLTTVDQQYEPLSEQSIDMQGWPSENYDWSSNLNPGKKDEKKDQIKTIVIKTKKWLKQRKQWSIISSWKSTWNEEDKNIIPLRSYYEKKTEPSFV